MRCMHLAWVLCSLLLVSVPAQVSPERTTTFNVLGRPLGTVLPMVERNLGVDLVLRGQARDQVVASMAADQVTLSGFIDLLSTQGFTTLPSTEFPGAYEIVSTDDLASGPVEQLPALEVSPAQSAPDASESDVRWNDPQVTAEVLTAHRERLLDLAEGRIEEWERDAVAPSTEEISITSRMASTDSADPLLQARSQDLLARLQRLSEASTALPASP